jgi:hypothetical protein
LEINVRLHHVLIHRVETMQLAILNQQLYLNASAPRASSDRPVRSLTIPFAKIFPVVNVAFANLTVWVVTFAFVTVSLIQIFTKKILKEFIILSVIFFGKLKFKIL